ncbi:MAG: hypothetical protein EBU90_23335, partial [Proteobacteria bacterium]|nr:hypothetical protein [Pseudomonadota bacterium]
NAYKRVIETMRLPKVDAKADRTVEHEILEEFTSWAESQLAALLGEGETISGGLKLTEQEVVFIKQFIARAQKASGQAPQTVASNQPQYAPPPKPSKKETAAEPIRSTTNKRPTGGGIERVRDAAKKAKTLEELAALEDEFNFES